MILYPVLLISQTDSTVYRIRLPDSTYSAQLRGVTGSPSDGETIDGTWSTEQKAHEFFVKITGPYHLYIDPLGGSDYFWYSAWGKSLGKVILGADFAEAMMEGDSVNVDLIPWRSIGNNALGDSCVDARVIKNDQIYGAHIEDRSIRYLDLVPYEFLVPWTESEAYEKLSISYDEDNVITTATVRWPDRRTGVFFTIYKNPTLKTIDAYQVTYIEGANTYKVVQDTVTRDESGNITVKPGLEIWVNELEEPWVWW